MTPALVVDERVVRRNVATAERLVAGTGKALRPHFKAHRTVALMRLQDARSATCATVGEAEVAVEAGVRDVLIANEVLAPAKLARLAALARAARVSVAVDSPEGVRRLSDAVDGGVIGVLIDVDVGLGRCGVRDGAAACELADAVNSARGLSLRGVMGYEGRLLGPDRAERAHLAHARLAAVTAELRRAGFEIGVVSSGGTSTLREAIADPQVTEIQAGSYAVMDRELEPLGLPFAPAARIVATVISRHAEGGVVDAGRKSIGCDRGLPVSPAGRVLAVMEEHTTLEWLGEAPALGSTIDLLPMSMATTFNLHDRCWLEQEGGTRTAVAIGARGRSA